MSYAVTYKNLQKRGTRRDALSSMVQTHELPPDLILKHLQLQDQCGSQNEGRKLGSPDQNLSAKKVRESNRSARHYPTLGSELEIT
jgi:hypothetical protein